MKRFILLMVSTSLVIFGVNTNLPAQKTGKSGKTKKTECEIKLDTLTSNLQKIESEKVDLIQQVEQCKNENAELTLNS
ncbi:MAG: hypothetical protein HY738_21390 [Bacteroidia bacterium]|nr:hypothetical protein [Bacteroidia bacterium]